ncbi:TPA: hypothetical protein ACJVWF_001797 [Streptococcus pneumoniae]
MNIIAIIIIVIFVGGVIGAVIDNQKNLQSRENVNLKHLEQIKRRKIKRRKSKRKSRISSLALIVSLKM